MTGYFRSITLVLLVSALGFPAIARAVSYSPIPAEQQEKAAKGIREKGETVCLFESGTADVRNEIHGNDILAVYRKAASGAVTQVGKIRVLSFAGPDYLRAEVVEGEVMTGDIAKKGEAASLVVSPAAACK